MGLCNLGQVTLACPGLVPSSIKWREKEAKGIDSRDLICASLYSQQFLGCKECRENFGDDSSTWPGFPPSCISNSGRLQTACSVRGPPPQPTNEQRFLASLWLDQLRSYAHLSQSLNSRGCQILRVHILHFPSLALWVGSVTPKPQVCNPVEKDWKDFVRWVAAFSSHYKLCHFFTSLYTLTHANVWVSGF